MTSTYDMRLSGITIAGTLARAEADALAMFGAQLVLFRTPVGRLGEDEVSHWLTCSKTQSVSLPAFVELTRTTHATTETEEIMGTDGLSQQITLGADILGSWIIYVDQREGGFTTDFRAWLAALDLEAKRRTLDGDAPIDAIIDAALAAEDLP